MTGHQLPEEALQDLLRAVEKLAGGSGQVSLKLDLCPGKPPEWEIHTTLRRRAMRGPLTSGSGKA